MPLDINDDIQSKMVAATPFHDCCLNGPCAAGEDVVNTPNVFNLWVREDVWKMAGDSPNLFENLSIGTIAPIIEVTGQDYMVSNHGILSNNLQDVVCST